MADMAAELRSPLLPFVSAPYTARTLPFIRPAFRLRMRPGRGVTVTKRQIAGEPAARVLVTTLSEREVPQPALLWIHGGGMIMGSPQLEAPMTGRLARELGAAVVSPDDRLAPQGAFDSTTMVGGTMSSDQLNVLVTRIGAIQAWITDQVMAVSDGDEEGILAAVRRALDDGTLQLGEVTTILHTLLSAGGESTTSLLGNAVRMLAEDPALQHRLREKPDDVGVFVEEVLRLESPFRQMMRSVPHDTTLGGTEIPASSTALLFFAAGNRDPAQFHNPDRVDLSRGSPKRHLAFGHGIHFCVGAALARIEARAVLTALLEQTREFGLDPGHEPQWVDSLLVRRHAELYVWATPL
jgi:cytochrome P450